MFIIGYDYTLGLKGIDDVTLNDTCIVSILLFSAFIAQGSAALAMLFWKLDPSKPEIVLMFYILWGIGESVFGPVVVGKFKRRVKDKGRIPFSVFVLEAVTKN